MASNREERLQKYKPFFRRIWPVLPLVVTLAFPLYFIVGILSSLPESLQEWQREWRDAIQLWRGGR